MILSLANLPEEQRETTVEFANYQMDDDDALYEFCQVNEPLNLNEIQTAQSSPCQIKEQSLSGEAVLPGFAFNLRLLTR